MKVIPVFFTQRIGNWGITFEHPHVPLFGKKTIMKNHSTKPVKGKAILPKEEDWMPGTLWAHRGH